MLEIKSLQTDVFVCRRRPPCIRNQFDSLNIKLWHLRCCKGCITAGYEPFLSFVTALGGLYQAQWHTLNDIRCLCGQLNKAFLFDQDTGLSFLLINTLAITYCVGLHQILVVPLHSSHSLNIILLFYSGY